MSHCKQYSKVKHRFVPDARGATSASVSTYSTGETPENAVSPVQYHAREYHQSTPEPRSSESVQSDPPDERDKRSSLPSPLYDYRWQIATFSQKHAILPFLSLTTQLTYVSPR